MIFFADKSYGFFFVAPSEIAREKIEGKLERGKIIVKRKRYNNIKSVVRCTKPLFLSIFYKIEFQQIVLPGLLKTFEFLNLQILKKIYNKIKYNMKLYTK